MAVEEEKVEVSGEVVVELVEEQAHAVGDDPTADRLVDEVPVATPAESSGARTARSRGKQRRTGRWGRTGVASTFGTGSKARGGQVGWSWEIRRDGPEHRQVRVEVIPGPYRVTDLPAEARNAIRSRGATAVDAFLDAEDPPVRIVVSTHGLQAHYADRRTRE